MRLLHGSNVRIDTIDLSKCRSHNDFGRGFYLTTSWQRAWDMGRRRKNAYGNEICVNAFIYNPSEAKAAGVKVKVFKAFTVEWARFVILNRQSRERNHDYDIVIGPVADAVFDQELALYRRECGEDYLSEGNLKIFVGRISQFGLNYIQYCFLTEAAVALLHKD